MISGTLQIGKKTIAKSIGKLVLFMGISMNVACPEGNINGLCSRINTHLKDPKKFIANNLELFHLLGCAMHLPYIFTVDSENETAIRASAISSVIAIDSKLAYELFRTKTTCLAKELVCDVPKAGAYALSSVYDIIRCIDAENVALKNKNDNSGQKMRSFKINQLMKLMIEGFLRVLAYASSQNSSLAPSAVSVATGGVQPVQAANILSDNRLSFYLSELADIVELWRLLSRYSTYVTISKVEANLNLVVHREDAYESAEYTKSDVSSDLPHEIPDVKIEAIQEALPAPSIV